MFAVPVMGFVVFLVIGSITGRVKMKSCCSIADPRCDARMRDAFPDGADGNKPFQPLDGRTPA
ncbi:MAG TPA: hypothetical protein VFI30_06400 [Nocardioidaceae bacterium]|nr:hypothetical protein [Nocardioidaceae bacterium]